MAHNNEEMKTMKKARYIVLVLLSSLLIMLMGCERRELLDNYPVSGVQVKIDWSGVTDKLPEGMKIIFYPKDDEGRKVESYLSVKGGEVLKVPPGRYAIVIYNYDTETILLRDEGSYNMVEAYPVPYTESGMKTSMVRSPEQFYTAKIDELDVEDSNEVLVLELKPELSVYTYSFEIKAVGLENVSTITGSVSGMDICCALGCRDCSTCSSSPIFFEATKESGMIKGRFSSFGPFAHTSLTRVSHDVVLTLELLKIDGKVQKVEVGITKVVTPPPPEEVGGEEVSKYVEFELPVEDDEIIVDKVDPIPPGGGGGIGGDVGDWGEGEDVEIPME